MQRRIESFVHDFAEAREQIAEANESLGTTYLSDDLHDADTLVKKCLAEFAAIKRDLPPNESEKFEKEHDLKMKQLEAELQAVHDAHE